MRVTSMNISLPAELKDYVEAQTRRSSPACGLIGKTLLNHDGGRLIDVVDRSTLAGTRRVCEETGKLTYPKIGTPYFKYLAGILKETPA